MLTPGRYLTHTAGPSPREVNAEALRLELACCGQAHPLLPGAPPLGEELLCWDEEFSPERCCLAPYLARLGFPASALRGLAEQDLGAR